MHDSALAVRRPGECTFFKPGCEIGVDKVEFTPEMVRVSGSLGANCAHTRWIVGLSITKSLLFLSLAKCATHALCFGIRGAIGSYATVPIGAAPLSRLCWQPSATWHN